MDVFVLTDQQELIYISFVDTQNVVWNIGTDEWKKSGIFMLSDRLNDDEIFPKFLIRLHSVKRFEILLCNIIWFKIINLLAHN